MVSFNFLRYLSFQVCSSFTRSSQKAATSLPVRSVTFLPSAILLQIVRVCRKIYDCCPSSQWDHHQQSTYIFGLLCKRCDTHLEVPSHVPPSPPFAFVIETSNNFFKKTHLLLLLLFYFKFVNFA